jgi:hypothetical protein
MLDHTQTPDRRLFALQKGVFLFSNLKQFSGVQIAVSDRAFVVYGTPKMEDIRMRDREVAEKRAARWHIARGRS